MPIFILIFVFSLALKEKNSITRISLLLIFSGGSGILLIDYLDPPEL